MITLTKGNILESSAEALVNTVNTEGVMGKGLALQFKEAYPDNYRLYRAACKAGKVMIGKMFITVENTLESSKTIVNFPTKTTWRKPSEYSYIHHGLIALKEEIIERQIRSIAIPPLGSHNGGLEWPKVKQMIYDCFHDTDCDIYIYEPSDAIIERLKDERVKLTPARAMMLDILCDLVSYGEFASVFAAEKIVYFLQRFGARDIFKIDFVRGYYGPYSKGKISHVLYYLNGSYIKGMGGMEVRPFEEIWILHDTAKTVTSYLDMPENNQYKAICESVKQFLRGYYSSYSLELLATIDYILQNDAPLKNDMNPASDIYIERINVVLKSWSDRKNKLFGNSKYLPTILEHLKEIN